MTRHHEPPHTKADLLWDKPDLQWQDEYQELLKTIRSWKTTEPYKHQLMGLMQMLKSPCWLLAWEMGTGKTAPVVWRIKIGIDTGEFCKILILAPLSVVHVWIHELAKHGGLKGQVVDARKKRNDLAWLAAAKGEGIWITNYEMAIKCWEPLSKANFEVVICDECHRIKNTTTQTNRMVRRIAMNAKWRYALSGTPAPNGPLDIHGTLLFLKPHEIPPSKNVFSSRYAIYGAYVAPWVRKIVGYKDLDSLKQIVTSVSSRVLKEDCLDLPPKTFVPIEFEEHYSVMRRYLDMKRNLVVDLGKMAGEFRLTAGNVIAASLRLQQILGGFPKDDNGVVVPTENLKRLTVLQELIDSTGDQPIIVWCPFRAEAEGIAKLFGTKAVCHHGGHSTEERQARLKAWQDGLYQILVCTTASLREGVTLTRASIAIYYSRTYHLADWLQTIDRIHRIGQSKPVTIYMLMASNTIDKKIHAALESKKNLQELILGEWHQANLENVL